jgi:hypothetical protein
MEGKTDEQYLIELREKYEQLKKISILETKRADDWEEKCELLRHSMVYMTMFMTYDDRN